MSFIPDSITGLVIDACKKVVCWQNRWNLMLSTTTKLPQTRLFNPAAMWIVQQNKEMEESTIQTYGTTGLMTFPFSWKMKYVTMETNIKCRTKDARQIDCKMWSRHFILSEIHLLPLQTRFLYRNWKTITEPCHWDVKEFLNLGDSVSKI